MKSPTGIEIRPGLRFINNAPPLNIGHDRLEKNGVLEIVTDSGENDGTFGFYVYNPKYLSSGIARTAELKNMLRDNQVEEFKESDLSQIEKEVGSDFRSENVNFSFRNIRQLFYNFLANIS